MVFARYVIVVQIKIIIQYWGHNVGSLLLLVAIRGQRREPLFPQEFDINTESPIWGKTHLIHHFALAVPTS
jgi:hypothetical protein